VKLLSDDKLVNAFLQGTEDAGNTLCKRYTLELRRFFTRRTENLQDAEDLAQETLGEAMANLSKLRDPRRFRGWLYKIAHGHLLRYYRAGNESGIHISIAEIPDDDGAGQANSVLAVPEHEWPDNRVIDAGYRCRKIEPRPRFGRTTASLGTGSPPSEMEGSRYAASRDSRYARHISGSCQGEATPGEKKAPRTAGAEVPW